LRAGKAESVLLALAVRGGMPASAWDPGQPMRQLLLARIEDLRAAHATPDYVLWQQGESDAHTDPAAYARSVRGVIALLRERGVRAPVLVARATRDESGQPAPQLREAQRALVDPSAGIFAGPDTDTLGDSLRRDGLHFSAEGIEALSALWLRALDAVAPAR
jgi:lysophospholipase L1-like esterase